MVWEGILWLLYRNSKSMPMRINGFQIELWRIIIKASHTLKKYIDKFSIFSDVKTTLFLYIPGVKISFYLRNNFRNTTANGFNYENTGIELQILRSLTPYNLYEL